MEGAEIQRVMDLLEQIKDRQAKRYMICEEAKPMEDKDSVAFSLTEREGADESI